ncbi:MAG TPA: DUF1839 family protein [Solirubrobacteraceae bacterium]|jgi:hypothetical protein|nr:DUF1839 family protein [Solirubrobacteraceae bacterium]
MSAPASALVSLLGLDPRSYSSHALHAPGRTYMEINCYTDILVELLHARGEEPLAAMGGTVRMDFEGDQWTFFKPAPEELELLYGIDIHEMQPYRPLPSQIAEQIAEGRTVAVEVDSWYLPDTAATSYRTEHVKTSIVAEAIDPAGERLHYFHATGLHELAGEDYRGVFRLGRAFSEDVLPPYAELVRFDAGAPLHGVELQAAARALLRSHLDRRPPTNPFSRFGVQLERDLERLLAGDAADYHAYAFATVRMAGSAFEAAGSHVEWLLGEAGAGARDALERIVEGCKTLSFRLARRRPFEHEPPIAALAAAWDEAVARLDGALG